MVATTFDKTTVPTLKNSAADKQLTTYPSSLKRLIQTLQTISHLTPTQIAEVVRKVSISTQELLPWADFTHPCTDSYGRKLVFHGGHFEIMVMSWLPGDFSAVHDHGATEWGAVQCFGSAEHTIYSLVEGVLKDPIAAPYTPGMVREVDHHLIHQMGNRSDQPFLSLHVYGCEQPVSSITGNARVFDLLEGTVQYTDGGVFFCLPENKINQRYWASRGVDDKTSR
ncbi:MAG: cysteine dioxygenase family protein [Cyanobacteria bacterium J06598_3]